ncbi:MAG TPA: hypothetical protein VGS41_03290, partial [Chthonomonadales bacterium]|nr:hypothetical protein [Chthonomonadales bacterium]
MDSLNTAPASARLSGSRPNKIASNRFQAAPRAMPLFYTGLRAAPRRILWNQPAHSGAIRFIVTSMKGGETVYNLQARADTGLNRAEWELPELQLNRGDAYNWALTSSPCGAEPAAEAYLDQEQRNLRGRLWLLDESEMLRLREATEALSSVADPDFRAFALALLVADLGLFQDAIQLVQRGSAQPAHRARALMAHGVQAIISARMNRHLRQHPFGKGVPAIFSAWVTGMEAFHRQEAGRRSGSQDAAPIGSPAK